MSLDLFKFVLPLSLQAGSHWSTSACSIAASPKSSGKATRQESPPSHLFNRLLPTRLLCSLQLACIKQTKVNLLKGHCLLYKWLLVNLKFLEINHLVSFCTFHSLVVLCEAGEGTVGVAKNCEKRKKKTTDHKVPAPYLSIHSAFHCPAIHWDISLGDT